MEIIWEKRERLVPSKWLVTLIDPLNADYSADFVSRVGRYKSRYSSCKSCSQNRAFGNHCEVELLGR